MLLRAACSGDEEGIAQVCVDCWRATYRGMVPDEYLDHLSERKITARFKRILEKNSGFRMFVLQEEDGRLAAYAYGGPERKGHPYYRGELCAVYIRSEHQRKGWGRKLVETTAAALYDRGIPNMLVWVLAENNARYFYESLGAKKVEEDMITLAGKDLKELAYGWEDIRTILPDYSFR